MVISSHGKILRRRRHIIARPTANRLAEAGSGTIWLNWNDGYRVVGEQCGQLATALISQRPAAAQLVSGDNVKYYEYSTLLRLLPPAPAG